MEIFFTYNYIPLKWKYSLHINYIPLKWKFHAEQSFL